MDIVNEKFELTADACDEAAVLIADFCSKMNLDKKDAIRYRLAAEDCLERWLKGGLAGKPLTIRMGKRFRAPFIILEVEGPQYDPGAEDNEDFGPYCNSVLVSLGLEPEYSYERGRNRVRFRLRRKPLNQLVVLAIVLASALGVGFAGLLLPDNVRATLLTGIVQPLYSTFFDLLRCIAGPMIFLSVAWGIYGIGDVETLGRIGKRLIIRYLRITGLVVLCASPLFFVLGPGLSESSSGGNQLASISEMVLGIIPSNIVEPFLSGNTLQIIFLAVVASLGLLYLGRRVSGVAEGIDQVNALVGFLMTAVSKIVPFAIFLVVVNMIWSGTLQSLTGVWKLIVVGLAAITVISIVFLVSTSIRRKVSVGLLARKILPSFTIALTTASSIAAFGTNTQTCEKKFGIDGELTGFGLPLGMVMHRPICATNFLFVAFFFAGEYGVACDPVWVGTAVFVACVLAIAAPPVPGGSAVVFAMLFAQMGIPEEALALALAVDVVADFYVTAFEQVCQLNTLVNVSAELDMIDLDTLRAA